jgi:tetratricopeptide (TPR) repeat protein
MSRNNLANLLKIRGKYEEAEAEHRVALALLEKALAPDHPDVAVSRGNLARLLLKLDRTAEALPLAEQAWAHQQDDEIPNEYRADTAFLLCRILWAVEGPARDRKRARTLAEDALRLYREAGSEYASDVQQWLSDRGKDPLRR